MNYRALGRTGLQVSEISLGTEYLVGARREKIITVVREAIAQGINYFDLFSADPAFRDAMGEAISADRGKVILAAHLGAATKDGQYQKTRSLGRARELIEDFLTRYNTDYVDVLFLHNCDSQRDFERVFAPNGLLGLARELQRAGRARYLAFSGHTAATAQQAVKSGEIDVLMYPISIASNAAPGRRDLLNGCVACDLGVVAMKPYGGGKLLRRRRTVRLSRYVAGRSEYRVNKGVSITAVQCLSYTLAQPGVSTVVPGCSNLRHLSESLAFYTAADGDKDFAEIVAGFERYLEGECVYCNHCLPCPSAIDVGQTIRHLEMAQQGYDARPAYEAMAANASDCIECGACQERCPFGVSVIEKMSQAVALFA